MIAFPNINPVIISFGPLAISWYSLSYLAGVLLGWYYASTLITKFNLEISKKQQEEFITYAILGIVIGGRLGYIVLYDPSKLGSIDAFKTWEGGMSFHGGLLGMTVACYTFCKLQKMHLFLLGDVLAMIAPIGLFFGRIANFINAELYGRVTDVSWAVIFPYSDGKPRHPSQIYESLTEGLLLFLVMFLNQKILKTRRLASGIFLAGYAISRIATEYFREPDVQIGFILEKITMGQALSVPMLAIGIYLIISTQKMRQ